MKKKQVMYIRCQCSIIQYYGSKVDKAIRSIIACSDYRNAAYSNDHKNQHHGQKGKGRNASHITAIELHLIKNDDHCSFSLAVYQDNNDYYMQSTTCTGSHQFYPCHDLLCTLTPLFLQKRKSSFKKTLIRPGPNQGQQPIFTTFLWHAKVVLPFCLAPRQPIYAKRNPMPKMVRMCH